jgi:hypothetical protein
VSDEVRRRETQNNEYDRADDPRGAANFARLRDVADNDPLVAVALPTLFAVDVSGAVARITFDRDRFHV